MRRAINWLVAVSHNETVCAWACHLIVGALAAVYAAMCINA